MQTTQSGGAVAPIPTHDTRPSKILAKTLFKDMVAAGLRNEQILAVASELIAQVTQELKHANDGTGSHGRA